MLPVFRIFRGFRVFRVLAFALSALALLWGAATEARADATCDSGAGPVTMTEPLEGQTCSGDMVVVAGTTSTLNGAGILTVTGNLTVEAGALLNVVATPSYATISVGGDLDMKTSSQINLDGQSAVTQPAGTTGAGNSSSDRTCAGSGAGHGGVGGKAGSLTVTVPGGNSYGVGDFANYPGSEGGRGTVNGSPGTHPGGNGGGTIRIVVGGLTTLDGLITANGTDGQPTSDFFNQGGAGGGGSGGGIYLRTVDLTTHNAGVLLSAVGGGGGSANLNTSCAPGGGGGGGRISVYYSGQNGAAGGSAISAATHMNCAGGPKGPGSPDNADGFSGSCFLGTVGATPQVSGLTPAQRGQGATNQTLALTGQGFVSHSQLEIGGAVLGAPSGGITIHSVSVPSSTSMTAVVSVGYTADPSPGANPKPVRVFNPDLNSSPAQNLFTVSPAPVIDHVEQGGSTVTGLARGFTGNIVIHGSNFQVGATVSFSGSAITVTGTPAVDVGAQTITVGISISTTAAAGSVTFNVTNPDQGKTQVAGTLQVLSQPVIDAISPDTLIAGQSGVTVTVTGSGFIAAVQLVTDATDVTIDSLQFDGFGQLTATLSVAVSADVSTPTRNLWVDNGDGGVSTPVTLTLEAVPAGVNVADLVYGEGTPTPPDRIWNGFGWSQAATSTAALPEAPDWVLLRRGRSGDDLLLATVDATRRLRLQERTSGIWGAVGAADLAAGTGRPVDAAAVNGTGGERFLVAYGGTTSGVPSFLMIGGGAGGPVPVTGTECTGGSAVRWVRVAASRLGTEAVVVYAADNGALCAVTWNGTGFGGTLELASATNPDGALATLTTQAFDATFWGAADPQQAMVAWGVTGSGVPHYAVWNGSAWTKGSAHTAASSPTHSVVVLRLAASARTDRVALVNETSIGELYGQLWGGTGWGTTLNALPAALVSNPRVVAGSGATRAFDVVWPTVTEAATVTVGVAGGTDTESRRWTPTGGWGAADTLPAPAGLGEPRWVQVRADPGGGDLLAGVAGDANHLAYYRWDGVAWNTGRVLSTAVPAGTEAFMADYRHSDPPAAPQIDAVSYAGATPAQLGAQSTAQTLTVTGTGFLNPPTVSFGHAGITVGAVDFVSNTRVLVTVSVGAVPPGTYTMTLQNPDGQTATTSSGLTVLAPPADVTVRLGTGAPACTPSLPGATACAFQDSASVPVEVVGTGFVTGAQVSFSGTGVSLLGSPVLSVETGTGPGGTDLDVLSASIQVAGDATFGARNVTVTNPDSSAGTGSGVFEVTRFVRLDSVTPASLGAGAQGVTLGIQGANLQPGLSFTLGSGVTVNSVTWNGTTQALVGVDVLPGATPGTRTVTVTNLDGGTDSADLFSVLTGPSIASVSPSQGEQGSSVHLVVTGTDLAPLAAGGGVALSGSGISVSGITASPTQVEFDAAIDATAPFATARDVILTRDNGGQAVAAGAFTVVPVPLISSVTPATVVAGETGRQLTLAGNGFDPGAVVTAGAGLVVRSQQVVAVDRIDISVDVGTTTGTVDLTVQNPAGQTSGPATVTITAAQPCTVGDGETLTLTPASASLVCTSLSVSATGRLELVGDMTLTVLNDATISGTLFADPSQSYVRLKVGGILSVPLGALIDTNATGFPGGRLGAKGSGLGGGAASVADGTGADSGHGGGHGGAGGNGGVTVGGGPTYDLTGLCTGTACFAGVPLEFGSGGGSGYDNLSLGRTYWRAGGAGGGTLVLDVAGNAVVDGTVRANGGNGETTGEASNGFTVNNLLGKGAGGGSGGSLVVLVGGDLSGSGAFRSRGGAASNLGITLVARHGTGGGGGRVAVYYGTTSFAGELDCRGGTSKNPDAAYQGAPGTCVGAPRRVITGLSPASLAQGASTTVQVQATGSATTGLAAGDTVLRPATGFTWGTLTGSGPFDVSLDMATTAALGKHDMVIRHLADQTGAVAFGALTVVPNPRIVALTPNHLLQGEAASAQLSGSRFEPGGVAVRFLRGGDEPTCGGPPCVIVGVTGSTQDTVDLTLAVDGSAPLGGYDIEVSQTDGGRSVLRSGFTVLDSDRANPAPALASVTPVEVGAEVSGKAMTLRGYDFGLSSAFQVDTLQAVDPLGASAPATLTFDPAGCPRTASACVDVAGALQRIDALVSTAGVDPGTVMDVMVSGPNGASTLEQAFTVNPRPTIDSFTPTSGEATFTLTVSGQDFQSGAVISLADPSVAVGATTASGADLRTTVTVGSAAPESTTDVRVTNPDGGSNVLGGLTLNPAPQVSSVTVTSLGVGQSTTVIVVGSHFHPNATVSFGADITVSNKVWLDAGRIRVTVSVAGNATPGSRDVVVTNPNGLAGTLARGFTIKRPAVLSSISPSQVGAGASHVLLLQGAELDNNLSLSRLTISGSGVTPLSLGNYRSFAVQTSEGTVTITSLDLTVDVASSAPTGPRTVTISNGDGSRGSATFAVGPPPVVSFVDPAAALRNQTLTVTLNGFNLDPSGPRICFGTGCDFGASSSRIYVTGITPVSTNRTDLTLLIGSNAPLGFHPITVENSDGGRTTKSNALEIASGFSVGTLTPNQVEVNSTVAATLSGNNFTTPQVAFLLPSGDPDPQVTASVTGSASTSIGLDITASASAAPGLRTVRVTNGTGAVLDKAGLLLVTNAGGRPTIGSLQTPDGAGGYRSAVLGLDEDATRTVTGLLLTGKNLVGATLTFGRPGLVVNNLVVDTSVDPTGGSATFDLDLPADTVPGAVSLTASNAVGSDLRDGALTVHIAPALTSLQPATLTPGSRNTSVLIAGGGFQDGAQVAVTPSGVLVRDLDSSVTGTQASFLSDTALRTVLDVLNLVNGPFTLTVTNPDGGRGSAPLTVASPTLGTPAKLTYLREAASSGLKVRDWSGAPGILGPLASNSVALPHVATREDVWTVLRANPMVPGEYLLAVGRARSLSATKSEMYLYRTLADGTSWGSIDSLPPLSSATSQAFDLAYEQGGAGRALLVYGQGTTLYYKRIDAGGSEVGRLVLVNGNPPVAGGTPLWVRLVPEPNGRRILVLYETNDGGVLKVQALIWNGEAGAGAGGFVSEYDVGGGPLTINAVAAPTGTGGVPKAAFDGAWEGLSHRAVVFWAQNGSNALHAATWDLTNGWQLDPGTSGTQYTGAGPRFVRAAADPGSDRIAVLANSDDGVLQPLVARFFVGGWDAALQVLAPGTTLGGGNKAVPGINFDLGWDDEGGLVVLHGGVYVATRDNVLLQSEHWTPDDGWLPYTELLFNKHIVDAVAISPDPDTGELMAVVAYDPTDGNNPVMEFRMYRWVGSGWSDEKVLDTNGVHWPVVRDPTNGVDFNNYGTAMAVAYREDLVPPDAVTDLRTDPADPPTTTAATLLWTAPGDNGSGSDTLAAGGYDIRWSDQTIVDDDDPSVTSCDTPPTGTVCFSRANQVASPPVPGAPGSTESVTIQFTCPDPTDPTTCADQSYTVALKVGDRANRVDAGSGAITLWHNVSGISNVLPVNTQVQDATPPDAITDLGVAAGANPESMATLSWTGVGDDGAFGTGPVLAYDVRMATLPISEVGGDTNFHVPFDKAQQVVLLTPGDPQANNCWATGACGYNVTGLSPGVTYYFAVKGLDEDPAFPAPISNVVSYLTDVIHPDHIDDLTVADAGVNTVTLAWTARGGNPTSYELRFATFPIDDANFASATPVAGVPAPAASGTRQVFTVNGLLPDTGYWLALLPVRYQNVGSPAVYTRLVPDPPPSVSVVAAATLPDPTANPTQPSAVSDLSVVAGTVRTNEVRLAWTAPDAVGGQALRYEVRWAHRSLATATTEADCSGGALPTLGTYCAVPVTLLPAPAGTAQEYTVTGLPENSLVYLALVEYDRSGLVSGLSNELLVHTALRRGVNALSVPGTLSTNDIGTVLGPYVGSCTSGGTPTTGSGPVGPCGVGDLTITAYRWDPTVGTDGDFVAAALTDPITPEDGLFIQADGDRAVVDVGGTDLSSYAPVPLPPSAPALISNPYFLPVAVDDLRIVGDDGSDRSFATAVAATVIDPNLSYFTLSGGALQLVTVTSGEELLPYRAYFIRLGPGAVAGVTYSVRMIKP